MAKYRTIRAEAWGSNPHAGFHLTSQCDWRNGGKDRVIAPVTDQVTMSRLENKQFHSSVNFSIVS